MEPILLKIALSGIFSFLIAGAVYFKSIRLRAVFGATAIAWSFVMLTAALRVHGFDLNIRHNRSASTLMEATAIAIYDKEESQVQQLLIEMHRKLNAPPERGADFAALADAITKEMQALHLTEEQRKQRRHEE